MWRLHPDVRIGSFGDSAVLLHVTASKYFGVNGTGALICASLGTSCHIRTLIDRVHSTFPTSDKRVVEQDVEQFLLDLEALRLCTKTEEE